MRQTIAVFIIVILLYFPSARAQTADSAFCVSLLALGDVNLGRTVGQKILQGDTTYPFKKIGGMLIRADIVFANLECPITDQNGETQNPKSNIIFCAPPDASIALQRAGITIVSTANNHAYDYGLKGLRETIKFLSSGRIQCVGTVTDSGARFVPVVLERKGIKVGIIAYTQTMNFCFGWHGFVSVFDSARAQWEITQLRPKVDFIIASYHGGEEYKDVPDEEALRNMRLLAQCGVDVVLGHHPHVTQGIEVYRNCLIFYSLGNAVFYQPQLVWTQRSFAALIAFEKKNGKKSIQSVELIPFRPGLQPKIDLNALEMRELIDRTQKLSTVSITHTGRGYFVKLPSSYLSQ